MVFRGAAFEVAENSMKRAGPSKKTGDASCEQTPQAHTAEDRSERKADHRAASITRAVTDGNHE